MPSSAAIRSLDALARSNLTHTHIPPVDRPAGSESSTDGSSTENELPPPGKQFRSTISTDLVGQLSTLEDPGIRTIDTNYDPAHSSNDFRYRGKSMEERHNPTEKLRKAASKASRSKTFDAFEKKVSVPFL